MAILEPFALAIGFLLSYLFDFTNSYGFSSVILTVIINIVIFNTEWYLVNFYILSILIFSLEHKNLI